MFQDLDKGASMKNQSAKMMLLATVAVVLAGCATTRAKKDALLPAIRMSWESVRAMADAGVAGFDEPDRPGVSQSIDTIFVAVFEGSPGDIVGVYQTDWPIVKRSAEQGVSIWIEDGTIGQTVSLSLMNEIVEFDKSFAEYAR